VTQRVVDVVFGALVQAIPDLVPAMPFGTTGVATLSGRDPKTGGYFVAVYPYPGGYGASRHSDGLVNGTPPGSMAKFMSVEMSEHRYPLRFEYYRIREGSGGNGQHRGGCGTAYGITALANCVVSILGDRVDHLPQGAQGGDAAAPNDVRLVTGGKEWVPSFRSKIERRPLVAGDSVRLGSPGGGGFGNPLQRDLAAVEADLNAGLIGRQVAEAVYGVVIAEAHPIGDRQRIRLDPGASEARRLSLREEQAA
jgi:N-methylhydantoinase B